jgi:hypothetical protein
MSILPLVSEKVIKQSWDIYYFLWPTLAKSSVADRLYREVTSLKMRNLLKIYSLHNYLLSEIYGLGLNFSTD